MDEDAEFWSVDPDGGLPLPVGGGERQGPRRGGAGVLRVLGRVARDVGDAIVRTAGAAGELLSDHDLRAKASSALAEGTQGVLKAAQKGELPSWGAAGVVWWVGEGGWVVGGWVGGASGACTHPREGAPPAPPPPRPRAGLQTGIERVQQGPRQVQAVLLRLQQRVEEERMRVLLEQDREVPVDVQVGGRAGGWRLGVGRRVGGWVGG